MQTAKRLKTKQITTGLEFAFFHYLWQFYGENRPRIRSAYKELTKKYLDFNSPDKNPKSFLRQPQYEALEVYVFLKEFLSNSRVEHIFQDWHDRKGMFAGRSEGGFVADSRQGDIFENLTERQFKAVFDQMRLNSRNYPNYIFALTMGTGKTILMATCIFYEFILANKFPKDERFCHNALVFAPDRTVLQSLKEIESFDLSKVVPPEYVPFLTSHLRFHYLDHAGTALSTLDRSRFNIIVSNTQKIILKRQHKGKSATEHLFKANAPTFDIGSVYDAAKSLYEFDQPESDEDLTTNQRFEKLCRLEQLGIYVDEAHHSFGRALAKDMGIGTHPDDTSLRTTIDKLALSLSRTGTRVVACYNYTGTPYIGKDILPEVVYAYGLREAIEKRFLKKVFIHDYTSTKTQEFVRLVIDEFVKSTKGVRPEGLRPKLAFFSSTIDDLTKELRPAVEKALVQHGISSSRILVNVGDDKLTTNDDIREFNRLDSKDSRKQYVLLVNKGREGWNCRSLFGVALFREPKSKVFVLQATMRCLRSVGEAQYTGQVYLSKENKTILDDELQQNFRVSLEELQGLAAESTRMTVSLKRPIEKIKLVRVRKVFNIREKQLIPGVALGIDRSDKEAWSALTDKYRLIHTVTEGLEPNSSTRAQVDDLTHLRERRGFSELSLVAEISRYLNRNPLQIECLLASTKEGISTILDAVNEFNELLYDVVIPRLFAELYELDPEQQTEEHEIELVKLPPNGDTYEVTANKDKIVRQADAAEEYRTKSFHLDPYCFDSGAERTLFWDLLHSKKVKKVFFTGMLTHGQSEFYIQYIDPESHTVRSYYPDFLFQREDGTYVIVEVKQDNKIDDSVVLTNLQSKWRLRAA